MVAEAGALTVDTEPVHLVVPRNAWDLRGFRDWVLSGAFPERARASWIGGEVLVEMSREAIDTHNSVKTEITAVLAAIVRDEDLGELYSDGVLYSRAGAGTSRDSSAMARPSIRPTPSGSSASPARAR